MAIKWLKLAAVAGLCAVMGVMTFAQDTKVPLPKINKQIEKQVEKAVGKAVADAAAHAHDHAAALPKRGVCILVAKEDSKVAGVIELTQVGTACHLTGEVTGLTPGEHGFHIHEFGDLRDPKGTSAGGHFNPEGHKHGSPDSKERHVGDLGNIKADEKGVAKVDVKVEGLALHFVLGRSLVVHAKPDDFSQPVGNAGPRVGVGVIGIAAEPKK